MTKTDSHIDMLAPTDADIRLEGDKIDLAHEQMGEPTGRIQDRFLPDSNTQSAQQEKREEKERQTYMLSRLSLDAETARLALYDDTVDLAKRAALLASTHLDALNEILQRQELSRQIMLERATRLHDGSLVFQDKHGNARYEDGAYVSQEDAATIVWREGSPSFEAQRNNADAVARTKEQIDETRTYESRVGEIQHELETRKDKLTTQEIEAMQEELIEGAPEALKTELSPKANEQTVRQETVSANMILKPF